MPLKQVTGSTVTMIKATFVAEVIGHPGIGMYPTTITAKVFGDEFLKIPTVGVVAEKCLTIVSPQNDGVHPAGACRRGFLGILALPLYGFLPKLSFQFRHLPFESQLS